MEKLLIGKSLVVRIDSEDKNKAGEILLKGDSVMLGYYKNEEATRNAFTEDGWLRTGDLGVIDEKGFLYIKGRCKNMLLGPNGQNIYPEEIEVVLNNMPYVSECLAVSRRSADTKGNGKINKGNI